MTNANFFLRLLAYLNDKLISMTVLLAGFYLLVTTHLSSLQDLIPAFFNYLVIIVFPVGIFWGLIHLSLESYYLGGSFGKLLTGLRLIGNSGQKLTFKKLLFRHLIGYIFSSTLFGVGFWAIFKDPEKKAWHDHAIGSKVVVKSPLWPLGIIFLLLLTFSCYYFAAQSWNKLVHSPAKDDSVGLYLNFIDELMKEWPHDSTSSATPSASPKAPVPPKAPATPVTNSGPGYNKTDIDNLVTALNQADKDYKTISDYYKGVSTYNQTTVNKVLEIIPERKALAQKLLDKMGKGSYLNDADFKTWDQYDALTAQQDELIRSLYNGNGGF